MNPTQTRRLAITLGVIGTATLILTPWPQITIMLVVPAIILLWKNNQ